MSTHTHTHIHTHTHTQKKERKQGRDISLEKIKIRVHPGLDLDPVFPASESRYLGRPEGGFRAQVDGLAP